MEKNNNSSSSSTTICSKIRQVLASYPAFRALHRIKQQQQNRSKPKPITITSPSPSPSPKPKTTAIRANPSVPQHVKVNTELGEGAIPINFDYTSKAPSSQQHVPRQQGKKSLDINDTFADYIQRASSKIRTASNVGAEANHIVGTNAASSNKMDNNQKDHFSDFIQHAKKRLRTTSNVGKSTSSLKRG